jgi:ATP-binding protein involved in chromosome partitioning
MNNIPRKLIVPKNVTDALRQVDYPGSDEDIVSMDMVQEIRIAGKKVSFSLVFQRSDDPNTGLLIKTCEDVILRELGPDVEIRGNITSKAVHQMERPVLPGVKNMIAIASGKGGVGKSTVAVNLAVALAKTGARVGLIDADIFGPSIPKMFGAENMHPTGDQVDGREVIQPVVQYGVKILSIGFFVAAEDALVWRGPMASNALKQLITQGNWGELDYLLIDLPPGTSDIHLTLVQTIPVTGVIIVTTPQDVALADVIKGVNMFRGKTIDIPVLGLVENMAWFTPEELPENRYYIFGKEGGKKLAEQMELPLLGQVPLVQGIREGGDEGKPVATDENSLMGKAFLDLAASTIRQVEQRNAQLDPTRKVKVSRK